MTARIHTNGHGHAHNPSCARKRCPRLRDVLATIAAQLERVAGAVEALIPMTAEDWDSQVPYTFERVAREAPTALQFAARPLTVGEQEAIAQAGYEDARQLDLDAPPDDPDDPEDDIDDDDGDDYSHCPHALVMYAHLMRREAKRRRARR